MAVNGAEEDGVDNRAEPSVTHGETVLDPAAAEGEDAAPAAQPDDGAAKPSPKSTGAASASSAPPVKTAEPTDGNAATTDGKPGPTDGKPGPTDGKPGATDGKPAATDSKPGPTDGKPPKPAGADPGQTPAYASRNGSAANQAPAAHPNPPVTSLMAPPGPAAGTSSGQASAVAAMTSAASGARSFASRIGASFAGLTKPRPATRPQMAARASGQAPWPQSQTGRRPVGARPAPQPGPAPRTALLSLQRIEPLSVMKFSSLLALVIWIVLFVAVALVWFALSKLGVFAKIEQTIGLVTYTKNHPGSNAAAWFGAKRVLGYTALVLTVNAFLFTALATLGAALYNLVTSLTGGVEVTLKETD